MRRKRTKTSESRRAAPFWGKERIQNAGTREEKLKLKGRDISKGR